MKKEIYSDNLKEINDFLGEILEGHKNIIVNLDKKMHNFEGNIFGLTNIKFNDGDVKDIELWQGMQRYGIISEFDLYEEKVLIQFNSNMNKIKILLI